MEIEFVNPNTLRPHPENPNTHPKDQIERLKKLIAYQGFRSPIIISKQSGFIVAGHARLKAAQSLKISSVPVIYQDFTEDQERAHRTADNAIASWSKLDLQAINDDIQHFDPSFDIEALGLKNFTLDPSDKPIKACSHANCPKRI